MELVRKPILRNLIKKSNQFKNSLIVKRNTIIAYNNFKKKDKKEKTIEFINKC